MALHKYIVLVIELQAFDNSSRHEVEAKDPTTALCLGYIEEEDSLDNWEREEKKEEIEKAKRNPKAYLETLDEDNRILRKSDKGLWVTDGNENYSYMVIDLGKV
jgi:hypothetical protein